MEYAVRVTNVDDSNFFLAQQDEQVFLAVDSVPSHADPLIEQIANHAESIEEPTREAEALVFNNA